MTPEQKTAARLREAQAYLGKTDREMDALIRARMRPWSYYTTTGVASAYILGQICRLTGWTLAYVLGESDDKLVDATEVRNIVCRHGDSVVYDE